MIFKLLASRYDSNTAEEILLLAMSLLGRLPNSAFVMRDSETCPRVSCPFSVVWLSCFEQAESEYTVFASDADSEIFTVQLLTDEKFDFVEFQSSCMESVAFEVERHERKMRSKQTSFFIDSQAGIDTGVLKFVRKIC